MTDNQQIVEIMKVLNECCGVYDENGRYLRNKCNSVDCEYWSDENHCCCSYGRKEAEALYNAAYRRVDENAVVLTRGELIDLQTQVTKNYNLFKTAKQETAKDFIFKVESYLGYNADNETFTKKELLLILAEVAKEQFGVEME